MKARKTITLLAAAVLLLGCSKEKAEPATASVTFSIGGVQTGTMPTTRGTADLLAASAPSGPFTIELVSTTNTKRKYTITTGTAANIICDTYTATCKHYPTSYTETYRSRLYTEPCFEASATIEVTDGTDAITLQASYTCLALVRNTATTTKYTIPDKNAKATDWTGEVAYLRCISTWEEGRTMRITAYPQDDANYAPTEYQFTTTGVADALQVENGKWYILNPAAAETTSGTLGVTLTSWEEGAEL